MAPPYIQKGLSNGLQPPTETSLSSSCTALQPNKLYFSPRRLMPQGKVYISIKLPENSVKIMN